MVKRYYHYYDGDDANDGTSALYPRKLLPGQTGAAAVSAGDEVEARAGVDFSGGGRVLPAVDNLTYRAYGVAENALTVELPHPLAPWLTKRVRVVREPGVHEGMWILNGSALVSQGPFAAGGRNGTVIEDARLIGGANNANAVITGCSSTQNASGLTVRRSHLSNSPRHGVTSYTKNVLVEWCLIEYTIDDSVTLSASAVNGYRAGSTDIVRYCQLREPNVFAEGLSASGSAGDWLQAVPSAGLWDGTLLVHDINGHKSTDAKQGMVLHQTGAGASATVRRLRATGGGDCQLLLGHIKSKMVIEDVYAEGWVAAGSNIPFLRFDPADVSPLAYAMDTGSLLRIRNVIARGNRCPGFYSAVTNAAAVSFDGTIEIDNCSAEGLNDNGLSYASTVALWSGSSLSTFGANFRLRLRNNALQARGKPQIILPTGWQADARVTIAGNNVRDDAPFDVGTTEYATLAEFEAAVSGAASNRNDDPLTTAQGIPRPGSPLLTQGVDLGYLRDIRGILSRRHCGAYGAGRLVAA